MTRQEDTTKSNNTPGGHDKGRQGDMGSQTSAPGSCTAGCPASGNTRFATTGMSRSPPNHMPCVGRASVPDEEDYLLTFGAPSHHRPCPPLAPTIPSFQPASSTPAPPPQQATHREPLDYLLAALTPQPTPTRPKGKEGHTPRPDTADFMDLDADTSPQEPENALDILKRTANAELQSLATRPPPPTPPPPPDARVRQPAPMTPPPTETDRQLDPRPQPTPAAPQPPSLAAQPPPTYTGQSPAQTAAPTPRINMVNHVNHTTNNIKTHTNCNNTAVSTTGDARPMTLLAAAVLTAASLQSLASPQRPALAGLSTPHLLPHSQGSLLLSPPTDPQQRNSDGNILLYSVPAHPTDPHQRDIDSSFLLYPAPSHSTSNDSDYSAQSPQGPAAQTPDPNYPQSPRASSTTTTRSSRSADKCSRTRDHHDGPNSAVGDDAPRRNYKCIDDWPAMAGAATELEAGRDVGRPTAAMGHLVLATPHPRPEEPHHHRPRHHRQLAPRRHHHHQHNPNPHKHR